MRLGHEVVVFDNFSSGNWDNLKTIQNDLRVIEGDIRDYGALESALRGADLVSHHAAQLEIFRSTDDPLFDLEVNTIGTLNVLRAAKKNGIFRVINASSACIYGQAEGLTAETHDPRPNWAYGISKLAAEKYCHLYNDYQQLPTVSFRYGIVYGEREWYRRVLTIFIKRALEDKPLVVFGDGSQVRDFINVRDVVAMNRICLDHDSAPGHAFNVGTGVPTTVLQLAQAVQKIFPHVDIVHENTKQGEYSTLVPDKKRNSAELQSMWLNPTKAEEMLGWTPQVSLYDGITAMAEWAKQNPGRWTNIRYSEPILSQ